MNDITHYYKLKQLCRSLADREGVYDAKELQLEVAEIAVRAICALDEEIKVFQDFVDLPHVNRLFDQWLEEQNK